MSEASVKKSVAAGQGVAHLKMFINGQWRTDQLAYGGIKSSGIGREGPRYAMRDMTEERLVLFNL